MADQAASAPFLPSSSLRCSFPWPCVPPYRPLPLTAAPRRLLAGRWGRRHAWEDGRTDDGGQRTTSPKKNRRISVPVGGTHAACAALRSSAGAARPSSAFHTPSRRSCLLRLQFRSRTLIVWHCGANPLLCWGRSPIKGWPLSKVYYHPHGFSRVAPWACPNPFWAFLAHAMGHLFGPATTCTEFLTVPPGRWPSTLAELARPGPASNLAMACKARANAACSEPTCTGPVLWV